MRLVGAGRPIDSAAAAHSAGPVPPRARAHPVLVTFFTESLADSGQTLQTTRGFSYLETYLGIGQMPSAPPPLPLPHSSPRIEVICAAVSMVCHTVLCRFIMSDSSRGFV
ncbi:unnamed protein product, partial [Iphiclides podalirius]